MKSHVNIPVFIPHLGCPNQCVFCNQRTISGVSEFDPESLRDLIEDALSTVDSETEAEIAFFGGSFTGIDRGLMISLLTIAHEYVSSGRVRSIRCSTRPDYINEEILDLLKSYSVNVIELGLQSADDEVLRATKRNHTFEDERRACELIVKRGFSLVGQMMIGLPASNSESEIKTADFIIKSGAVGARIYPTVVFRDTELCAMATDGFYQPLSLEDSISRSADVLERFIKANIPVIRIGLCASENLMADETYFAGPNHPALGELVENEVFYRLVSNELKNEKDTDGSSYTVFVPKGAISKAVGQKSRNKIRLLSDFSLKILKFAEDDKMCDYSVRVCRNERTNDVFKKS